MISYTLIKPGYELLLFQFLLPLLTRKWKQFKLHKAMDQLGEAAEQATAAVQQVAEDAAQGVASALGLQDEGGRDEGKIDAEGRYERRLFEFHEDVENQRALGVFKGVLDEYNTKVIRKS